MLLGIVCAALIVWPSSILIYRMFFRKDPPNDVPR